MEKDWDVYGRGEHSPGICTITIRRVGAGAGGLGLSARAVRELGSPSRVVLLFNPEKRMIGIRSMRPGEENIAYRMGISGKRSGFIAARKFAQYYDLTYLAGNRFAAYMDGDMLVAQLPPHAGTA